MRNITIIVQGCYTAVYVFLIYLFLSRLLCSYRYVVILLLFLQGCYTAIEEAIEQYSNIFMYVCFGVLGVEVSNCKSSFST